MWKSKELTGNIISNIYSLTENYVGMSKINRGGEGKRLSPDNAVGLPLHPIVGDVPPDVEIGWSALPALSR